MEVLCDEKTDNGYDGNASGTKVKEEPVENQNKLSSSTDCAPNLTAVSSDLVRLENTQSDSGIHPVEWFTNRFSALAEKFTRDLYSPSLNPSVGVSYPQTAKPVGHKSEWTQSSPLSLAGNSPGMIGLHPHQSYRWTPRNSSRLDINLSQPVASASEDVDMKPDLRDSVPSTERVVASAESLPSRNHTPCADSPVSAGAGLPEDSENGDSALSTEPVPSESCVPSRDALSAVEQTSWYLLPTEDCVSSTSSVPSSSPMPETLVSKTSVPETFVPETSISKTSVPETSMRETSVSENSVPETLETEPLIAEKSGPETHATASVPPTQTLPPGPYSASRDTSPAGASEAKAAYAALASSGGLERSVDYAMEMAPYCVTDKAEMPYLCPECHSYSTTRSCDCRRLARQKGEGSSKAGMTRRPRRRLFTSEQVKELEETFKQCTYLKVTQRQELADKLGLPDKTVKVWFQNRRSKEKRADYNQFMLRYRHLMPPQLAFAPIPTPTPSPYPNTLHATPSPSPLPPSPQFQRLPRPSSPSPFPCPALPPPSLPPPRPSSPSPYPRTRAPPPPPPPHHAHRSAFHTYPAAAAQPGLLTSQPKVMSQAAAADVMKASARPEVLQPAARNELLAASPAPSSALPGPSSSPDEESSWLETLALVSLVKHTKGKSVPEISQLAQQLLATGVGGTTPCPCPLIPGMHTTGTHLQVLATYKAGISQSQLRSL